jgi:hypothetical protein
VIHHIVIASLALLREHGLLLDTLEKLHLLFLETNHLFKVLLSFLFGRFHLFYVNFSSSFDLLLSKHLIFLNLFSYLTLKSNSTSSVLRVAIGLRVRLFLSIFLHFISAGNGVSNLFNDYLSFLLLLFQFLKALLLVSLIHLLTLKSLFDIVGPILSKLFPSLFNFL